MAQFNMQIDPDWQKKVERLQSHWHLPSKADVVRRAVDLVFTQLSGAKHPSNFWTNYADACRRVPRKPNTKSMSEQEFYKGLAF